MSKALIVVALVCALVNSRPALAQPAELMLAARAGDVERVNELLSSGAQPDPDGIASPLFFAAQGGHVEIANILLGSGANPNAVSTLGTPLTIAARRGHGDVVRTLLRNGADPNLTGGEFENTPLHEAAVKGAGDIGRMLIEHGADVNARNVYFEPPIHLAMEKGRLAFAELLRHSGASAIEVEPIAGELANADLEKGRIRALECGVCHQLSKDDNTGGDGPRLWGIVGRPVAGLEYDYSDALKAQTGSWTYERLNAFLADPAGTIPGSGMYRGYVADRSERISVIAYLRTLSEDPEPLP